MPKMFSDENAKFGWKIWLQIHSFGKDCIEFEQVSWQIQIAWLIDRAIGYNRFEKSEYVQKFH